MQDQATPKKFRVKARNRTVLDFKVPRPMVSRRRGKTADEELDSDHTDDDAGDIDDIDLRLPSDDEEVSGEEDPDEDTSRETIETGSIVYRRCQGRTKTRCVYFPILRGKLLNV